MSISSNSAGAGAAAPEEKDATVTVAGVEIACRFTLPSGKSEGAVLLLPGSLYSDVDGNYPSLNMRPHAYADLARQLGERGFAVLRMAKIGPGTGSRTLDASLAARHTEFLTRVVVGSAGLALLRRTVAARPVIVAGHSEGAVVASLLAAGADRQVIDGVVSLSGPALPILDILREQVVAMAPPGAPSDMTLFDRTIAAIRAGDSPPADAKRSSQTAMLATMPIPALAYLRSADRIDPVAALARVQQPVLIVQGGRDASVSSGHADMLKDGRGNSLTEAAFFPTLTHFYKIAPPDLPPMQSMGLVSESDPAVADIIAKWSHRVAGTLRE
ncbi:MAG: alpha/beta fold hydrolase [Duganella sp.]